MRKSKIILLKISILTLFLILVPVSSSAQNSLSSISWEKDIFFANQKFVWQYDYVSFNGAIQPFCPCENDTTTLILRKDLSELNLVTGDINILSNSLDHRILTKGQEIVVDNSTLMLDLEGIPFIYPVIREYLNGTRINRLEELVTSQPVTNYTELLYVTREVENGVYIQRKVFSSNPWFRFETKIDLDTGIMLSLWFEEGFYSSVGQSFSRIYTLNLISDLLETGDSLWKVNKYDFNGLIASGIVGSTGLFVIIRYRQIMKQK